MITMLIASAILAISFLGVAVWRLKGLPESISSMVYTLKHRWLWTLWIWAVAFLTCIPAVTALDRIGMGFLGFGTLACILFCGAMPLFLKDNTTAHWVSGTAGCILSQLSVWFIGADWLFAWTLFLFLMGSVFVQPTGGIAKAVEHRGVLVAECVCYISYEGSLLMYYL